jgi:hypothetical protein
MDLAANNMVTSQLVNRVSATYRITHNPTFLES